MDEDKPFIICYDHKRMKVIVTCHYGLWNEFLSIDFMVKRLYDLTLIRLRGTGDWN